MESDRFRGAKPDHPHGQRRTDPVDADHSSQQRAPRANSRRRSVAVRRGTSLVIGLVVIIAAFVVIPHVRTNAPSTDPRIDQTAYQAVFINGSATTYFGKIQSFHDNYIELSKVFYTVSKTGSTAISDLSDVTLNKLGCELHGPQDSMYIDRSNVLFWENLRPDSQVAMAINGWYTANPSGQEDCAAAQQANTTPRDDESEE